MSKHIPSMDENYAVLKVTDIDDRLNAIDEEKKALTEKRKLYAAHLPRKSTTAAKSDD